MKKSLFMALAAAGMLSACSSHDDFADNGKGNGIDTNLSIADQINIGVTTGDLQAVVRGTGTVGDTAATNNQWAGQDLWIYMVEKGTVNPAKFTYTTDGGSTAAETFSIYENKKVNAPTTGNSGLVTSNDIRYYPLAGTYDFWGYRIDDAAANDEGKIIELTGDVTPAAKYIGADGQAATKDTAKVIVPFIIDGSQDLMAGKAAITEGEAETVGENYYSSYAARRNVQPNIAFNHLLTRFTFTVLPGNESTAGYKAVTNQTTALEKSDNQEAAQIEEIAIGCKSKGNLVVAYKAPADGAEAPELLEWAANQEEAQLVLKQRPSQADVDNGAINNSKLVKLEAVALQGTLSEVEADKKFVPTASKVGEALLVEPGLAEYPLYLTISQKLKTTLDNEGTPKNMIQKLKTVIKAKDIVFKNADGTTATAPDTFEAGKSYNITIKVYGYEKIEITATLIPWKDGGTIDKDSDTDDNWSLVK